jgi:hypothetical protein
MNPRQANFEDLVSIYLTGTEAHVAAVHLLKLIQSGKDRDLANLLRDHRARAIELRREIEMRAAIDRLMNCCSVMEIASRIGFIPNPGKTQVGRELRIILGNASVRRYYEEFYPVRLPQLFRQRLAGRMSQAPPKPNSRDIASFMSFIELDRRFMANLEDGTLLRMLDSFVIGGYWFSDIVELIGKPGTFIKFLLRDPARADVRARALHEFSLFMQFCFDLHQILQKTFDSPVLQSALWNHYAYWFEIIGDELREQLGKALGKFLDWTPPANDRNSGQAVQTYVRRAQEVLADLTSRKYANPIERLLNGR